MAAIKEKAFSVIRYHKTNSSYGRDDPAIWPRRSRDTASVDLFFFFLRYNKDPVFISSESDTEALTARIMGALETVAKEMLENVQQEVS